MGGMTSARSLASVRERQPEHRPPAVALSLILDALAAYRLTKLVTADTITAGPRAKLIADAYRRQARAEHATLSERIGRPLRGMRPSDWDDLAIGEAECAPKIATLVTCRWCASVHVAVAIVLFRWKFPRAWRIVREIAALSAAATLTARLEE